MKKNIFALYMFVAMSMLFASACSDEESSPVSNVKPVDVSVDDLDALDTIDCDETSEGLTAYVKDIRERRYCLKSRWVEADEWKEHLKKVASGSVADDTVASFSSLNTCYYSDEGRVTYVSALKTLFVCTDGDWMEYALQSVPDSVSSIKALPVCMSNITGAIIYVTSVKYKMICSDEDWVEYDLWLVASSSSTTSSSSYSSSSSYRSSSSSYMSDEEIAFGVCTDDREGEIAYDTNAYISYYGYGFYICEDGDWEAADEELLDTLGWSAGKDGDFRPGDYSYKSSYYSSLSSACLFRGEMGEVYYVYDKDAWREAERTEVCLLYACTESRVGEKRSISGHSFSCTENGWVRDSLYNMGKTDFTNPLVTYGALEDLRDGHVYKTIVIGGKKWMAQDLNYADSIAMPNLKSSTYCHNNDEAMCNVGGRGYTWTAAMNLDSAYSGKSVPDSLIQKVHQGVCPSGWHLPDTTEWRALYVAANNDAMALMAKDAWPVSLETSVPKDMLGFSMVPGGFQRTSSYIMLPAGLLGTSSYIYANDVAEYCTMREYNSYTSYSYVVQFTNNNSKMIIDDEYKTAKCHVRCVENE